MANKMVCVWLFACIRRISYESHGYLTFTLPIYKQNDTAYQSCLVLTLKEKFLQSEV